MQAFLLSAPLASPELTRTQFGDLDVARISTGSLLYRAALGAAAATAEAVRDGSEIPSAPSYESIQRLAARS